ncbi:hypothetical protein D5086_014172 [Populus alba]|uniref:Uncharacterized protein n=1 Tax=Populus alba TaxID=43335 RepID=A0ACC4C715_POPAL
MYHNSSISPEDNRIEGARTSGKMEAATSPLKPENLNQFALIFSKFKPDNRIKALVKVCRTKSLPSSILAIVLYPFSLLVLQLQFEPHRQEIIPERNN